MIRWGSRVTGRTRSHTSRYAGWRAVSQRSRAGEDAGGLERGCGDRVDLEHAPARPGLQVPAHLVEQRVHAVAVERHRHAVGGVVDLDRAVRGEPDADRLPAPREAAEVARVD